MERHQIRLEGDQTKNEEPKVVPLPAALIRMLAEAPKKSGRVFYTDAFRRSWASACVKTELGRWIEYADGRPRKYQGLIVHDLRRSAVKNLRDAGVPETVIKFNGK